MNFCTHFDNNYLPHALTLSDSLNKHTQNYNLFMMCMDDISYNYLKKNTPKNATILSHKDLEKKYSDLLIAKSNRNDVEYFFTCSPSVCNFILEEFNSIKHITYLDADLYFFFNPEIIFDEIGEKSIAIIEHRFHWITKRQIKYGKFNVGWITFKNDLEGRRCLKDWRKNCIEWCYQKVEDHRFGDQKYLDKWPLKYSNLCIVQNKGANVAIWNIKNYNLSFLKGIQYVDEVPLIFYHFANINQLSKFTFNTNLSRVFVSLKGDLLSNIYLSYLTNLTQNFVLNKKVTSKKDNHVSGIIYMLTILSRKIRAIFFNELIKINHEEIT
jgi:hypothetical protein